MQEKKNHLPDDYDIDEASPVKEKNPDQTPESDASEYSLDDEEEEFPSGDDTYEISDEETDEVNSDDSTSRHITAWKLMLKMMINPVEGWKNIRREDMSVDDVAKECFYPIIALAATSSYLECLWEKNIGINQATINALMVFVAFFFGNFLILLLIKLFFPKSQKEIADSDFGKKFVMYNLSTLALFYILYGCFPMIGPILVFLPLWTIYLVLRGSRFFMFPNDKRNLLKTLLCTFIIGAPVTVLWAIDLIL